MTGHPTAGATSTREVVDSRRQIAYGPCVRRSTYRLVLPEGRLRRFRLPDSLGEDVVPAKEVRPLPLAAVVGWLGVCACSWFFARGAWDPIAMLDRRWDMPRQEGGAERFVMAGAFASGNAAGHDVLGRTQAPSSTPRRVPSQSAAAPVNVARVASTLPRVKFPDAAAHAGGWRNGSWGVPGVNDPASDGETDAWDRSPAENGSRRDLAGTSPQSSGLLPAARSSVGGQPFESSLGEAVRDLFADSAGLPKPNARRAEQDPFEADFGAGTLPPLGAAGAVDVPVAMRSSAGIGVGSGDRRNAAEGAAREQVTATSELARTVTGERGAVTWNGGCQRAFDASVQAVGQGVATKDATSADYTRVLSRLDIAACHPRAATNIEVCVAVGAGRAAGVTVHTTPSSPSVGNCIARRIRSLSFPASGGTDLVRTQFRVD